MKPATLLKTWKTLLTVLLEHDKFREELFQQCLVSSGDHSFLTLTIQKAITIIMIVNLLFLVVVVARMPPLSSITVTSK